VVRPLAEGGYELVVGERRWRAAQRAGLQRVPAVVRRVADGELLETALTENLQRQDLNAIEEAQAYRALIQERAISPEQLATRVGKQRATIANALRLLSLPSAVQDKVRAGELSMGHARAILGLSIPAEQVALAERTIRQGLSVRQVESLVAIAGRRGDLTIPSGNLRDPNVVAAEETLQRAMGTKVRVVQGRRGGRIEVYFYSPEELERAYQLLLKAAQGIPRRSDKSVGASDSGRQVGRQPTRESAAD
jgi:ParB family chromosome partitioning protein